MNKEIKFRIWYKTNNCFLTSCGIGRNFESKSKNGCFALQVPDDEIWMPWIGIEDKNKKEIYTGDIVLVKNQLYNGKLSDGNKCVVYNDFLGFQFRKDSYFSVNEFVLNESVLEVIGNIFENQNLLQNEETIIFAKGYFSI